ncbi:GNAT family N-acetyltransferase [Paenibacillus urinalis]|uniref:GNAT family N-acetyltransferase n=1 Tax=Paenibacillus urinalis TaxID=521520 RepID=A0AAX3N312_9BACL|nr:GNAT family N-acetyltransferase [Paenibacillus urinalis]WDH83942.1 GNAT family N-acetyltransferase [Paenibacillus urinalis]
MKIDFATEADYTYIADRDQHISKVLIASKIRDKEILMLRHSSEVMGWMRYGYFWDNTPFMNLIWLDEPYRGKGYGKETVLYWEQLMRQQGYTTVMTSTQSDEGAQHFYRKLGYKDVGCLMQENEPLEILFTKKL